MLYAIMGRDLDGSLGKRMAARPAHVQRLRELQQAGRLILAGPHPAIDTADPGPAGFTGSLIVAEFESIDDARSWADQDPYAAAGVYAEVIIKPFKKVLP